MNNNLVEQARHSIHRVHELIQQVFTDADGTGEAALEPLMAVFAEHFSMVTTSAVVIGREQVEQLFSGAVGARKGLEIVIEDLHAVWQEGNTVALRYKETHRLDELETSRVSVAIVRLHHHDVQWLYLHETPISVEQPA
ncbi:DUF4440 domain-containing protein [Pseudomonas granadensis]|uniref:DUF4440 domain-containing protein n=1 Tax=Pseudomonas granadensis TaxID=1421430 RepID=A0ABX7GDQ9_9PSED|nr:DUF4440 domain-containing protein [Pseudomonas granadensis]MBN6773903.1 DUF4440 domain-containing protein [Pseudomonas granadensis]MBN6804302.1 DUF4440 domain-containing protein [Pseudomonas granadensis]MBN6831448.1 DUF4440 domain-containing protein [Pseudomonas granadensis]MBN6838977.1 DUF4440 domain-containing protein [Pseudomonas granadensis]MBN6868407.1 DUF4440 domain-containing protein [Pseudomonas granadensis]